MPKKPTRISINLLDKISGFRCQSRQQQQNAGLDAAMAGVRSHPPLHGAREAHAWQGHSVTFLSTPRNTRRLIDVPPDLASLIRVVDVSLPPVEHLPEGAEASIDLPSDDLRPYLRRA
jgi:hypothetical protein